MTGPGESGLAQPVRIATLPDHPVGSLLNGLRPGAVANDRGFMLGTLGSGLWRARIDPPDEFYMVTDRGPNGQIRVGNDRRRTFPIPEWTPLIVRVRLSGSEVVLLEVIPVVGASGLWVTGLPNIPGYDEIPYDYAAAVALPHNPSGLDPEDIVRTSAGDFWLGDEYGPSLVHVDARGQVLARYVPIGLGLAGADYPIVEALPPIYLKRKINRGFEGLTLSGDERTLYLALQSPLLSPDAATGNRSRQTRILAWDIASARLTAEYVYRFDDASTFAGAPTAPEEMKICALAWVNPTTLLVDEVTDRVAKIYRVDLAGATNILATPWSDPENAQTLESLTDPASAGVRVLPKTLVIDLTTVAGVLDNIEGIAIVDATTLAIANDNNSDIGDFDAAGNNVGKGVPGRILYVRLDQPLPL
jgi:hypothetical protein